MLHNTSWQPIYNQDFVPPTPPTPQLSPHHTNTLVTTSLFSVSESTQLLRKLFSTGSRHSQFRIPTPSPVRHMS